MSSFPGLKAFFPTFSSPIFEDLDPDRSWPSPIGPLPPQGKGSSGRTEPLFSPAGPDHSTSARESEGLPRWGPPQEGGRLPPYPRRLIAHQLEEDIQINSFLTLKHPFESSDPDHRTIIFEKLPEQRIQRRIVKPN